MPRIIQGLLNLYAMSGIIYEGIIFKTPIHTRKQKTYEVLQCADIVRKAIKEGILEKECCEICGSNERIHAHHEDYYEPLRIRWLCDYHHNRLHSLLKNNGMFI